MIPLVNILEKIRSNKKMTRAKIAKQLGISVASLERHIKTEHIPDELIEPYCKALSIDIPNIEALYQYNARERTYRSIPEVVAGRPVSHGTRYKIATIMYFNIQFDLPQNTYIKELYPNPFIIDETIRSMNDKSDES